MSKIDGLSGADPSDLDALRSLLAESDPGGRLRNIGMRRVEIGASAIDLLGDVVREVSGGGRVVIAADRTKIMREGEDLKARISEKLGEVFEVREVFIGSEDGELHPDDAAISETEAALEGADCVVSVGSGTITDLCKEVTGRSGGVPLVVVQSANSVNAYAVNMSVLLRNGVKRTKTSRWPDALIIDLPTLVEAPAKMNLAGLGDLLAAWTAPADWRLASLLGQDDAYNPLPLQMLLPQGREVLALAGDVGGRDPEALEKLARCLALGGMVVGVTGDTAPLSGTEHLVSHMLDLHAGKRRLPFNFHGAQVGVATVPVAAVWEAVFSNLDPASIDLNACFPEVERLEGVVRAAFDELDPTGEIGDECWSDYRAKISRWNQNRRPLEDFLSNWATHRNELSSMVATPKELADTLREAAAPSRFGELDSPPSPETALWAFKNCLFMRNRFTVADLLFLIGWWNDDFVEGVFERASSVGGGL